MDNTPKNKVVRPRHTPTPKMSDRKKSLFTSAKHTVNLPTTIDEDDDSDLGPMSPLQFSSSPTSYDSHESNNKGQFMRYRDTRTNFKNIMTQLSPINGESERCQSITPKKNLTTQPNSPYLKNVSTYSSSEMALAEKENCVSVTLKTPGEGTTTPRISFRKSLIFDTGLTPDDGHTVSPKTRKCVQKRSSLVDDLSMSITDAPKARASLSFTEQPVISAKTFYGSSFNELTPKRRNVRPVTYQLPKPVRRVQSTSSKRSKSNKQRAIQRPVLGNIKKGVRHKITKPKVQTKNKIVGLKSMSKTQIIEAAIDLIQNRSKPTEISQSKPDLDSDKNTQITSDQIERLQKILKNRKNIYEISSKPLNWCGSSSRSIISENKNVQAGNENKHPTENRQEVVIEESEPAKPRKFFKSKTVANANKYTVMKGLCATVKRGAGVTLLSPKQKKQKYSDYDEYLEIQQEVDDIISMLDASQTSEKSVTEVQDSILSKNDCVSTISFEDKYEKYRQMIPYNTSDPEIQKRQETFLDLLITNDICTDENFKIFIIEPELHKEEMSSILDQLIVVEEAGYTDSDAMDINYSLSFDNSDDNLSTINDVPMSPASQISTMTLGLALGSPKSSGVESSKSITTITSNDSVCASTISASSNLFPIFDKLKAKPDVKPKNQFIEKPVSTIKGNLKKWKLVNDKQQLQIDAGQKEYGGTYCKECGMYYTYHVPEEDELHRKYHNARLHLNFKGWQDERVVCHVPQWERNGRIIFVTTTDPKVQRNRVTEILDVVGEDLGFVTSELRPQSIVYLAIAKQKVIGVCVAEPLKKAYPLIVEKGIQCMEISQPIAVKCGISRIWVIPSYRRCGIATRLIAAVRLHFIGCYSLKINEIAFSSPTDMGRMFAGHITKKQIFVYDESCF